MDKLTFASTKCNLNNAKLDLFFLSVQRKAWHPQFKVEELTLAVIKQNLEVARAEEATRAVNETGVAFGEHQPFVLVLSFCTCA